MKNVKHSKGDPNWMTPGDGQPIDYLAKIRACLGGTIWFDPFTSEIANQYVKAALYYTPEQDGFVQPWHDGAHINPPGLRVADAWLKLCSEILAGRVSTAMWTGFSVEQLCILADPPWEIGEQGTFESDDERWSRGGFYPMDFSYVMLRKRISFVKEDGTTGSPSHGNYIVGVGIDPDVFEREFRSLGMVYHGPFARKIFGIPANEGPLPG